MDLQYYQYFLEIAKCRSISRAAENLYVSQPYLSKTLSRLEKELGAKLIDRSSLPIRLTPEGECLKHYALQILELDQHLRKKITCVRNEGPPIVLGSPPFLEGHVMPQALNALAQIYPYNRFRLTSAPLTELMQQLQTGELQAIFALQHPVMSGVSVIPVVQDRILLLLPPNHPLYCQQRTGQISPPWFDLKELSGSSFIMPPLGSINRQRFDLILSSFHIHPHISIESNNPDAVCQLTLSGHGLSFTPETVTSEIVGHEALNYVLLEHPLTYDTLVLAYYQPAPFLKHLVDILQTIYLSRRLPQAPPE